MKLFDRIRRWFDRGDRTQVAAADPGDLHGRPPDDPGSETGLERPLPAAGPMADPPVGDPPPAQLPDQPLR